MRKNAFKSTKKLAIRHGETTLKSITSTLALTGLTLGLLLTQIGCTESGQEPVVVNPALATPVPEGMVRGTVAETMNAAGYTYVLIKTEQEDVWLAVPKTDVMVGDLVQASQGMAMPNFESKSLNRTFEVVYFSGELKNLTAPAPTAEQPAAVMPPGHPSPDASAEAAVLVTKVAELVDGQNIAYVYANKDTLAGQQISLRGKVVKYNEGILGTNFIHIQDGSGDAANGSNDLTVTSQYTTAMGETIIVTGNIILNKDFGAGYSFPVMIEDAVVTTE